VRLLLSRKPDCKNDPVGDLCESLIIDNSAKKSALRVLALLVDRLTCILYGPRSNGTIVVLRVQVQGILSREQGSLSLHPGVPG
ncbi:hypothetical protein Tco_1378341, partial [Tanacetum coccineum]